MKRIMEISDVFELPRHGIFIVGMNSELEILSPSEIRKLIGKRIVISYSKNDERVFDVLGVDIPISMAGKKASINICIGHSVNLNDIIKGCTVYGTGDTD